MTQDEFSDDLIRHCEQTALEAVAADTGDLVRAVLSASNHTKIVAERDIAWASNAGLTTDVLALRAQNAELVAERDEARRERETMRAERLDECEGLRAKNADLVTALEELRERILQGKGNVGHVALIDAALAAAGHKP